MDKGLNFIPTPKQISKTPILEAASQFGRRLKIAYHFRKSKFNHKPNKFIEKSKWEPPDKSMPSDILETIQNINTDLKNMEASMQPRNLSKLEDLALKELKSNPDIVIKKADKGSATVIMDKDSYISEGYRQLGNPAHYKKLNEPIFRTTGEKINEILNDLHQKSFISSKQLLYLKSPLEPRPRRFYLLPKIHKPLNKWPFENKMPPGRPIISDCESESYRVAEYIDHFLQEISQKHSSYIKDTYDFLSKLRNSKIKPDTLLVTLDVEAMYTNIDNDKGLEAVKNAFTAHPSPRRSDEHILELLELNLKNNDFEFNGETFLQISGTAMGKKFAPSYANLFMAQWETTALEKCYQKPTMYFRYLDDIWILWDHGETQFQTFFDILNSHSPAIRLSARVEKESIDFLDVTVYKGPRTNETGILDTKVFFKPTDTHQLLNKSSFHPKHTFSGILKSQIIRFYRICSQFKDFEDACTTLFVALRKRGYSSRFLRSIKSQALAQIKTGNSLNTPFPYDPNTNDAFSTTCDLPHCPTCEYFGPRSEIISNVTKQGFKIQSNMNCNSNNLIYLIECDNCGLQYIGQTKRSLRHRFHNHRYDILNERKTSVANHFNQLKCEISDCSLTPIFKCPTLDTEESTTRNRLEIEQFFIRLLKTYQPFGLNISQRKHPDSPTTQFVVPYSALASKASKTVRHHYFKLQEKMPEVYPEAMIVAYKRNRNLGDILVSSKIKPGNNN